MTESDFNAAAEELAKLNGITAELAGEYLSIIGDTPELENGEAIVRDAHGAEIARVKLPEDS